MSALSDYAENKILDHTLGTAAWTMPATVYLGLSVASIGDDASGTELSGNGYVRQAISFASASSGSASTDATVTFPTATGSWGSIGYWSVWDASSSGNLLMHGAFTTAKTVGDGDILRVNSGDLTITAA